MASPNPNPPIPPANADLITTWAFLEEGVDHIMTKLQTGVSYSKVSSDLGSISSIDSQVYSICRYTRSHTTTARRQRRGRKAWVLARLPEVRMPFPANRAVLNPLISWGKSDGVRFVQ